MSNLNSPALLKTATERMRRRALLDQPHIEPLSDYVAQMRAAYPKRTGIPDFDPCDGGTQARVLFCFEAPPRTLESGFISRDNPDPTAANCRTLFDESGIAREATLLWNVVPWRMEKSIMEDDVRGAAPLLRDLLKLLPQLEVIVLFGQKSWLARPILEPMTEAIIKPTWMPSAQSFNGHHKRPDVLHVFQEVAELLKG